MPEKIYVVELTADERTELQGLISKGKAAAHKLLHARILLKTDRGPQGPAWKNEDIAQALDIHVRTVERVRKRFVRESLEAALNRKKQTNQHLVKVDGDMEASLIALACSKPPEGAARWTMRMLADRLVELQVVGSFSYETVRRTLEKTQDSLHTKTWQLAEHRRDRAEYPWAPMSQSPHRGFRRVDGGNHGMGRKT